MRGTMARGLAARAMTAAMMLALPVAGQARRVTDPSAALAGRVAGKPTDCIPMSRSDDNAQVFDTHAILFRTSGDTWYLNSVANCPQLLSTRGYVRQAYSDQMCSGDMITIIDPPAPTDYGMCSLGDFVPYTKPR